MQWRPERCTQICGQFALMLAAPVIILYRFSVSHVYWTGALFAPQIHFTHLIPLWMRWERLCSSEIENLHCENFELGLVKTFLNKFEEFCLTSFLLRSTVCTTVISLICGLDSFPASLKCHGCLSASEGSLDASQSCDPPFCHTSGIACRIYSSPVDACLKAQSKCF